MNNITQVSAAIVEEGCNWDELCLSAIDHTWLGIFVEVVLLVVAFIGLAILCDERLMPALECLCLRWLVREDVAGSIFLAIGNSAPEIIISTVATLRAKTADSDDVNLSVGAVIGSGAIAFLIIPAICIMFAPVNDNNHSGVEKPVEVKRRPLFRDIGFYFLALASVIYFMWDGEVTLYESGTLCALYAIYLVVVVASPKIRLKYQLKNMATKEEKQALLLRRSVSFIDLIKAQKEEASLSDRINTAHNIYSESHPQAATPKAGHQAVKGWEQFSPPSLHTVTETVVEEEDVEANTITQGLTTTTKQSPQHDARQFVQPNPKLKTVQDIQSNLEPLKYQSLYDNTPSSELLQPFQPVLVNTSYGSMQDSPSNAQSPHHHHHGHNNQQHHLHKKFGPSAQQKELDDHKQQQPPPLTRRESPVILINDAPDEEEEMVCNNRAVNALYIILSAPLSLLFEYTIPEAKPHGEKEHLYPIAFSVSFVYLAFFSLIISAVFGRWTDLTGVGGDFFGLILVSSAAELPDLIQSTTAARNGFSSMAMSCISSQIANILIGFGMPWFVSSFVRGTPIYIPGAPSLIRSAGIQLINVVYFFLITIGFALWYNLPKVHLYSWMAKLNLGMYCATLVLFAAAAFLWVS